MRDRTHPTDPSEQAAPLTTRPMTDEDERWLRDQLDECWLRDQLDECRQDVADIRSMLAEIRAALEERQ